MSAPPTKSVFLKDGRLTPDEFIEAGDKLTSISKIWKWKEANGKEKINKYFPESK